MRTEIFERSGRGISEFEKQYQAEISYLNQTCSYKEGMRYKYSPDNYDISNKRLVRMQSAGSAIGAILDIKYPNQILEFRLDFIDNSIDNQLYITEVQTDDRGLPAVAIARNARGQEAEFPGTVECFTNEIVRKTGKSLPKLLITYPLNEEFYYAGFNDFATLCWATNQAEVIVAPREDVILLLDNQVIIRQKLTGQKLFYCPDLSWDFSMQGLGVGVAIQPFVTKELLLDIAISQNPEGKKFIPDTRLPDAEVIKNKEDWVLKPINGRWSKGILFGQRSSQDLWEKTLQSGNVVAQRFIPPQTNLYNVRIGTDKFRLWWMYERVEGYYVKNSDTNLWELADVLTTCTEDIPVHGKRGCIMIPGKVRDVE
ncbi:hypothetical protein A2Z22_00455 [Candidatus Woesebacteria bacterium RBG_16_34_12]|uniref:Uncharacterized protein n=1 Tax=Candidatus Woesebacteria bacterium RBG_16_34_12 TaxID=1802480 RepID=A0A1F7X904_9BACT|nr:MAG: hypothetical protein A2Z22_00455 [Candidatus Woesebacteria bacterium RBG_16_34_12]